MPRRSLICVPLQVESVDAALLDADAARASGADLVEFRIDTLAESTPDSRQQTIRLLRDTPLPCILTCRPDSEGGAYTGPEEDRLTLLHTALASDHPPAFVDVELAALERDPDVLQAFRAAKSASTTRVIVSIHDFRGRPADLSRRLVRLESLDLADVRKIAFVARSLRDNLELLDLCRHAPTPTIALGMGGHGLPSRVLAPKCGGFLTFAALRAGAATAPGQPTIHDLLATYRFREIHPETRVYGIVGDPVEHSLSPAVHNAAFEASGHDGVYLPMPVAAGDCPDDAFLALKATLPALIEHPSLCLHGLSITIPHKEPVVRLARELGWTLQPGLDQIGAANTLTVERDATGTVARVTLANTDADASVRCVHDLSVEPVGSTALILGAGGVARAVAVALLRNGGRIGLSNRSESRARQLAEELRAIFGDRVWLETDPDRLAPAPDLIVNCTPVGMAREGEPPTSPLSDEWLAALPKGTAVFDTVYRRGGTPLVRKARSLGLRAQDGLNMFVYQAAAQFELWTKRSAPMPLLWQVARELCG
ncbi:MAG: type I 3-dehydroquinate dehydratase [Phycisphaeraceae bacterium]|nr:type I 3-dehydroquinate dehydratase [Phycisphaeraceae bacterium]